MKKKALLIIVFFISLALTAFLPTDKDYNALWKEVENYQKKGLPKSAIKVVNKIYTAAKKEQNSPQKLKALIYKAGLKNSYEENPLLQSVADFESELSEAKTPEKQILYSLTAELYQKYFSRNRYKILQRGQLAEPGNDPETWDAMQFNKKIKECYLNSLKPEDSVKAVSLKEYSAILKLADSSSFQYRPILYDLLASRAINYFSGNDFRTFNMSKNSSHDSDTLLVTADKFIKLNIEPTNSTNRVLRIYQHLIKLHLNDDNPVALVNLDLARLDFTGQTYPVHTKKMRALLEQMFQKYKSNDVSVRIAYRLAENYKVGETIIQSKVFNAQLPKYSFVKAREICKQAVELHPNAPFANNCRNFIQKIEQPSIAIETEKQLLPEKPFLTKVDYKNLTKLWIKIVKVDSKEVMLDPERNSREWAKNSKYLQNQGIRNMEINLPDFKDYRRHTTEFKIDGLPLGTYFIYASANKDFKKSKFLGTSVINVTRLSFIEKPVEEGTKFLVQNRETGVGIKGVKGTIYNVQYRRGKNIIKTTGSFNTGENGFGMNKVADNYYGYNSIVRLIDGSDTLYETRYLSRLGTGNSDPVISIHLFTDRSIYRPGQAVYYKGIVVQKDGDKFLLMKNYHSEITLKNANYKTVSTQKVVSNEFGSFSGSFVIPTGSLNGNWRLWSNKGSVNISVEEYKRPSFQVLFDTVSGSYQYNDEITVTGKVNYYNSAPVAGAVVAYRVTRQNYFPIPYYYYRRPFTPEEEVANGTVQVNEDGTFSISFKAVPGDRNNASEFIVYADVTDITGEVHTGKTNIRISNRSLWITIDAKKELNKDGQKEVKIAATNTAGKPLSVSGKLKIFALQQPASVFIKRLWSEPDTFILSKEVYRKEFPRFAYNGEDNPEKWKKKLVLSENLSWTGDSTLPSSLIESLKDGYYKMIFTAKDHSGKVVTDSITTLVFGSKSKRPATNKVFWSYLSKSTAEPGETVHLLIASAEKNSKVYYELTFKNKVIDSRWIKLNKKQVDIPITIREAWRGGVKINLIMVKNNRRYVFVERVKVPFTNKNLIIQLQTRRNHLTPGKKETWSVKISGYKGDKMAAELLAAMYDQSLDQIKKHQWSFNLFHQFNSGNGWDARQFPTTHYYTIKNVHPEYLTEYIPKYPEINWFGMDNGYRYSIGIQGMAFEAVPSNKSAQNRLEVVENNLDVEEVTIPVTTQNIKPPTEPKKEEVNQPVIRTDFRETAFFYPQLHTDSTGSVIFSFTTPDALTQWKLMMLAHTQDLSYGMEEMSFKAFKELMIMPNVPRFVRQGDRLMFAARVTNFSDKEQQVKVNLNFFDPVTNKKLNLFLTRMATEKRLRLKAGESAKVSWMIAIPDGINLMAYHIEAASETFSDGEERMIPVLTNRVLVTETLPMYVNAHGQKKYKFSRLINQDKKRSLSTLKNFRYTMEFTSNPAWYAIQALPGLSEPSNKSASNLFRAFFANSLSGWIVNSTPKIKAVFNSWNINSPDAFLSALQKNQELKNTVLEETPWVLEAESESEQKKRIALLFDLNNLQQQQQNTLEKLQQLQRGSGAWPWFKGMGDDRYTTQNIVLGMAKLLDKGVITLNTPGVKNMLQWAVNYLDKKIKEDYNKLLKQPKVKMNRQHISSAQIQYLYARTLLADKFGMRKKSQKAFDYYLGQAKQYWLHENNYLQAMIAVVMFENGNHNEAEAILRSLEERSLYSDEMGMYWRADRGWYWYQAPVETQAMIIEAFSRLNYNPQNIDKMKIWLLKQKQTQRWPTSSATAEAVYTFLMIGNGSLLTETKPVSIRLGGKPLKIDNEQQEAGTGYFKKAWPGNEVTSSMGNIEVKNPNNHITWGAAYWQYFENIGRITASKSPLYVEKKLYIEKAAKEGTVLHEITNQKLKTGDKIVVRLIIRTDRDMEFVQLKDVLATGMEVTQQLSGYRYSGGLGYYRNNKDASTSYFIRYLNKGTYVLEYPVHLTQQGVFPVGLATIQCLYAPEFGAHSQGETIIVEE